MKSKAQAKLHAKVHVKSAKPAKPQIHIGRGSIELALFEFQHAAICFIEAFYRHVERQLIHVTGDPNLSAQDCIILHAIRLGESPRQGVLAPARTDDENLHEARPVRR